jgi:hypothetical protein
MAMEKIHTYHGNFAEVARKAQSAGTQIRQTVFGKINPQERVNMLRYYSGLLIEYADCLQKIWDKEKEIQNDSSLDKPYIKIEREEFKDEDISKPAGND